MSSCSVTAGQFVERRSHSYLWHIECSEASYDPIKPLSNTLYQKLTPDKITGISTCKLEFLLSHKLYFVGLLSHLA